MHNHHAPNDKRDTKEPAPTDSERARLSEGRLSATDERGHDARDGAADVLEAFAALQTALRACGYTIFAADVARLADNFTIAALWGEASGQSRRGDGAASPSKKRKTCPKGWCRGCAHQEYVDTHPEVVDEMNKLATENNWKGLDECLKMISSTVTELAAKRLRDDPHAILCKHDMAGWANGKENVSRHLLCIPSRRYEVKCVHRCIGPYARRGGCACRMHYHVQSRHAPATHKSLIPPPPSV
jgi:hypothetical protein